MSYSGDKRPSQSWSSPVFILCAAILVTSALGLRPVMQAFAEHYDKEPIGLRKPLETFDHWSLRTFKRFQSAADLEVPTEDVGTEHAIVFHYEQRASTGRRRPASLFVTYYADENENKVAHTPEVCYRQAGWVVEALTTESLPVPGLGPDPLPLEVRVIDMERDGTRRVVMYVFCASGTFVHGRNEVRWILGRLSDRYYYYSKIETTAPYVSVSDKDDVLAVCRQLLIEAIPELVKEHFPPASAMRRE